MGRRYILLYLDIYYCIWKIECNGEIMQRGRVCCHRLGHQIADGATRFAWATRTLRGTVGGNIIAKRKKQKDTKTIKIHRINKATTKKKGKKERLKEHACSEGDHSLSANSWPNPTRPWSPQGPGRSGSPICAVVGTGGAFS